MARRSFHSLGSGGREEFQSLVSFSENDGINQIFENLRKRTSVFTWNLVGFPKFQGHNTIIYFINELELPSLLHSRSAAISSVRNAICFTLFQLYIFQLPFPTSRATSDYTSNILIKVVFIHVCFCDGNFWSMACRFSKWKPIELGCILVLMSL